MMDPFDTLGVEPRFDLDLRALEQRHRELSKALHPDRWTGASSAERRLSLSRAIDVNEAFRTLRDPIKRAEAIARRAGVPIGETSEPKPSPALLMEMMEAREELAEARANKDLGRVASLAGAMRDRMDRSTASLGRAIDAAAGDAAAIQKTIPMLGELRYLRRFLDEVSAIEEELAP